MAPRLQRVAPIHSIALLDTERGQVTNPSLSGLPGLRPWVVYFQCWRPQQGGPLTCPIADCTATASEPRRPDPTGPRLTSSRTSVSGCGVAGPEDGAERRGAPAGDPRTVLKASPFLGKGHPKVKARLAAKGIRVGKNRVLRLVRAHGLLAPVRRGHPRGDRSSHRPDPDRAAGRALGHVGGAIEIPSPMTRVSFSPRV